MTRAEIRDGALLLLVVLVEGCELVVVGGA